MDRRKQEDSLNLHVMSKFPESLNGPVFMDLYFTEARRGRVSLEMNAIFEEIRKDWSEEELRKCFEKNVVGPLTSRDVLREEDVISMSSLMDNSTFARECIWHFRLTFYEQLLNTAEDSLQYLNCKEHSSKLHSSLRAILKCEQYHFANWILERKCDSCLNDLLSRRIWQVLLKVMQSSQCPLESCLLAGTAFGFFLHSLVEPSHGLKLFLSVLSITDEEVDLTQQFSALRMNESDVNAISGSSLYLLNGLFSCGKNDILLEVDETTDQLAIFRLLSLTVDLCRDPKQNSYHAFSTLLSWLRFVEKNVKLLPYEKYGKKPLFDEHSVSLWTIIEALDLNWCNPTVGVSDLVWDSYRILIEIHHSEKALLKTNGRLMDLLLERTMSLPSSVKGKYPPLALLIPYYDLDMLLMKFPAFLANLTESLASNMVSSAGCEVYRVFLQRLCAKNESETRNSPVDKWKVHFLPHLLASLCHSDSIVRRNAVCHWLSSTLKLFPAAFDPLLECLMLQDDSKNLLLAVTVLRHGRSLGLCDFSRVNETFLRKCLNHLEEDVRKEVFAFLCQCHKKAEPLSDTEIALLEQFLPLNLNVDCASFRQQLVCNFKVLMIRLRDSCLSLLNRGRKRNDGSDDGHNETLCRSLKFLNWIQNLLLINLSPGGCYQRRQSCLLLFRTLLETFCFTLNNRRKGCIPAKTRELLHCFSVEQKCDLFSAKVQYSLLCCTADCMDEVKELALALLQDIFSLGEPLLIMNESFRKDLMEWALCLCSSPKTMHSESGATLFKLLFSIIDRSAKLDLILQLKMWLQQQFSAAKDDMLEAAKNQPMHGLVLALSKVLCTPDLINPHLDDQLRPLTVECVELALDVIAHILAVLASKTSGENVTSPSFADMGDAIEDIIESSATTKQARNGPGISLEHQLILACCWLSLKQCCLFLGNAVHALPIEGNTSNECYVLDFGNVVDIGRTLMSVLLQCRHRGAIEACTLGFQMFCQTLLTSTQPRLQQVVFDILKKALEDVTASASVTSATRRSAGLPLLIQTLLSSNCPSQKQLLSNTIGHLLSVVRCPLATDCKEVADLPQARALHVLQALIHDSHLSQNILIHLEDIAISCLDCFHSPSWAVRNAVLQLFGALLPRLLGQKKVSNDASSHNRVACDEFFARWPKLLQFFEVELRNANPYAATQFTVLPVLSLLSRLAPTTITATQLHYPETFVRLILPFLSCPSWHIRRMAARSIASLLRMNAIEQFLQELSNYISHDSRNPNLVHGGYLVLRAFLEELKAPEDKETICRYRHALLKCLQTVGMRLHCPFLQAAAVDVVLNIPSWLGITEQLLPFSDSSTSVELPLEEIQCWMPGFALFQQKVTYLKLKTVPSTELLTFLTTIFNGVESNIEQCDAGLDYLRDLLCGTRETLSFDEDFWLSTQNMLSLYLQHTLLDVHILSCLELILDIYTKKCVSPNEQCLEKLRDSVVEFSKSDCGMSVRATSLAVWAVIIWNFLRTSRLSTTDIPSWTDLIHCYSRPRHPELFRLLAARSLTICGYDFLKHLSLLLDENYDSVLTTCTVRIFEAALLLLQDEQLDVRREAATFVSRCCIDADDQIESIHSNLAISRLIDVFIKLFYKVDALSEYCWMQLNCSDLETVLDQNGIEVQQQLFEQEDVNVYAEKCFMNRHYVDFLRKCLTRSELKFLNQTDLTTTLDRTLSTISMMKRKYKPAIGCMETITQTKLAWRLSNLCSQLDVFEDIFPESSTDSRKLRESHSELQKLIGLSWN